MTDYPDAALIDNIAHNVRENIPDSERKGVHVEVRLSRWVVHDVTDSRRSQGYIWGHPVEPLLELLPGDSEEKAFDLIILSDLIFNHSQVERCNSSHHMWLNFVSSTRLC